MRPCPTLSHASHESSGFAQHRDFPSRTLSASCGGGYLPHRFSKANGYANPSVYCDDLYATFEHIESTLAQQVCLRRPDGERVAVIPGSGAG
jgi:hypothetical protein